MRSIIAFIVAMWALILAGGGIVVALLGPLTVSGYGELDGIITSGAKAAVAVALVAAWVLILTGVKRWIFRRVQG